MIYDNIKNANQYINLNENIKKGLKFLQETDWLSLEPGEHLLDGKIVFAIVSDYETKPVSEGRWEAHQKYYDIQYIAEGIEKVGFANILTLEVDEEYNEQRDVAWLKGEGFYFPLSKGFFTIFYPQDAHAPALIEGEKMKVRKVVIKVSIA